MSNCCNLTWYNVGKPITRFFTIVVYLASDIKFLSFALHARIIRFSSSFLIWALVLFINSSLKEDFISAIESKNRCSLRPVLIIVLKDAESDICQLFNYWYKNIFMISDIFFIYT